MSTTLVLSFSVAPLASGARRAHTVALAATAFVVAFAACPALGAQGPGQFSIFASRQSPSTSPLFAGLSLAGYSGIFGLRASGSLAPASSGANAQTTTVCGRRGPCRVSSADMGSWMPFDVQGWTADADIVIAPFRSLPVVQSLLLGFSPYAFGGIGGFSSRLTSGRDSSYATLSYGAGVQHQLLGWLGLDVEARNRRALHGDSTFRVGSPRDWTYRVGLTVNFGGGHSSPSSATQVVTTSAPVPLDRTPLDAEEMLAARAARVLDRASDQIGAPYRPGGDSPTSGFDAPGFVRYVMGAEGVSLPFSAQDMSTRGREISTRVGQLQPGDLLFFANTGTTVDHVAIYVGHDRIVHASGSAGAVRYDVLGEGDRGRWFAEHLVSARRVLYGTGSSAGATLRRDAVPSAPADRAPMPTGPSD
ncbi:MAG TPA: C40 family peptidase [Gemmatimonadaceae bacterium]